MIDWLAPIWLFGLLLLPLVWWLHRRPADDASTPVSSLLLWQNTSTNSAATTRHNQTDPLWWLRALIITLLLAAAATPSWLQQQGQRIEVWFDDSASMQTQEAQETRMEMATAVLLKKLENEKPAAVILHSLTQANHQLVLNIEKQQQWRNTIDAWLQTAELSIQFPDDAQMSADSRHWLVTDGADHGYPVWLESAPIAQLIQVGELRQNTAISRLSLRPSLDNKQLNGLAVVSQLGDETVDRQLTIAVNGQTVHQWPITLRGYEQVEKTFSIAPADNITLSAVITPTDILSRDDRLELTTQRTTPLHYHIQGDCSQPIQTALSAHPMLRATGMPTPASLSVVCGAELIPTDSTTLWFYTNDQLTSVDRAAGWIDAGDMLNKIALPAQGLSHFATQTNQRGKAILKAGNTVLIEAQESSPRLVKVSLDFDSPGLAGTIEQPLLMLGLIDFSLGQNLIDSIDTAQHAVTESDITPRRLSIQTPKTQSGTVGRQNPLAPWLITLALLLLACDVFVILLRRSRDAAAIEAGSHA